MDIKIELYRKDLARLLREVVSESSSITFLDTMSEAINKLEDDYHKKEEKIKIVIEA